MRRAGIPEGREQLFAARLRDLVDLAVRLAFLRDVPALDQPSLAGAVRAGEIEP